MNVFVCTGPVCGENGAALHRAARRLAQTDAWQDHVEVHKEACLGYCHQGPNVMLCAQPDAWGRAPLPGSEGCVNLHEVTETQLVEAVEAQLRRVQPLPQPAPAADPVVKP